MKPDIHPTYETAQVRCSCGNTFTTRSTKSEIVVELCNECSSTTISDLVERVVKVFPQEQRTCAVS